jgi:hypothetical protein
LFVGAWAGLAALWQQVAQAEEPDVLERAAPLPWKWLRDRLYVDEFYGATVIAFYGGGRALRTGWIGACGAAR